MNISVSQAPGRVPVTVLKLDGQLDGQNYQELIAKAQELFQAGARDFLMDLSDLTYISSAGLVALHSVGRTSEAGVQRHVKLLNPRSEVMGVLDMVGFSNVFDIYTDRDEAINSF
jgi:anti-anti-sigma factor